MEIPEWLSKAELIFAAIIAIIVSVLDLFGFLTNFPWITARISAISLLLIALLITFVAFQEKDYSPKVNSKIAESTDCLVKEIKNLRGLKCYLLKMWLSYMIMSR